jgi:hypothetical protein
MCPNKYIYVIQKVPFRVQVCLFQVRPACPIFHNTQCSVMKQLAISKDLKLR